MRLQRAGVVTGAVLVGVTLVAGCTSGTGDAAPPSVTAGSSTPASSATGTSPATSPATSSSSGSSASTPSGTTPPAVSTGSARSASGPGLCTPTIARMSAGPASGGLGHFGVVIVVTNASSSPCATTGYPGVAQLDASSHQLQQAQRTTSGYLGGLPGGASPAQIVLQPGQQASALLEGLNGNPSGAACASSPAILFTLPDNTDSTTLTTTTQVCQDLQIHPLVVGATGSANG